MPRILIVEDERIVATDIAGTLGQLRYQIAGMAASADEALALASSQPPDLALVDVRIRGARDGISLARELRDRLGVPVVFLSAFADDDTVRRARAARPYGYVVKPFSDRELRTAIEVALHHHELEARLETVLANVEDGVALLDEERRLVFANRAYCEMFGIEAARLAGMSRDEFMEHLAGCLHDSDEALPRLRALSLDPAATSEQFTLEHPRRRIVRRTVKPVRVDRNDGYLVVWHDETAEFDLSMERERRAAVDPLTGVGNRASADAAAGAELARLRRTGERFCVAVFDIDDFKRVNDTHGHPVGDAWLRLVASVLLQEARGSDTIIRWGGDEFVALLPGALDGAMVFCERVRSSVEASTTVAGRVTVTSGIAEAVVGDDLATVLARADQRLYEGKRLGRNRVCR